MIDVSIGAPVETGGARPPATAPVVAVVVTRGPTEYLERTLEALADQHRRPDGVLVADAAPSGPTPSDDAGHGAAAGDPSVTDLVARWFAASDVPVAVVPVTGARTMGDAVRAALPEAPSAARHGWLWLLHDDSAPAPDALAHLVGAVELAPSVAVAGCKQHSWSDPPRVLEVGVSTSRFGRRMTGLDGPEVDQGQHDAREDVLGVGTAGMLVRRDVWDDLGGTDPALGPFGDGLDLCRRARLAGHRVVVVPDAVVRHAQASLARPVAGAVVNRPGWDARRAAQAQREAFLHTQLVGVPLPLVPVVAVLALVSGVLRALGRLVAKEPHLVVAELLAPLAVLGRFDRVVRARRRDARTRRLRRRTLRPLQVTWRDVVGQWQDRRLTAAEVRRTRQAPSELEIAELAALRTRRRAGLAAVALVAVAVSLVALGPSVTRVLAGARLVGGTLLAGDADLGDLVAAVVADRVPGGFGHAVPADPLLTALTPLTALTGSLNGAAALLLLGSLVLAALGAWFAAGAATRSVALRAWAALAWTGAPVLLLGLSEGRLGAVVAHATLPWVVLGTARAVGVARVDVVESGLVGAQRRDGTGSAAPEATRTAEPSFAAAAGAGLALAVATAAAPVLLPLGLVVLLLVALVGPARRRLGWVALPPLALHAPLVVEAVRTWGDGGWRVLLAEPGDAVVATAGPVWQQLLGWPVRPPEWVALPEPVAAVVPLVATGGVVLVALLALARGGRAVRAVRLGWLLAALGLAGAVVVAGTDAVLAPVDGTAARTVTAAWHGPALSVVLAGLLVAALCGADGVRAAAARYAFGWRQVGLGLLAVVVGLGPVLTLGAWAWDARADGAALTTSDTPVVPAVGRQMQVSDDAVRVLLLRPDGDGGLSAALLRGDGRRLTETSRAVTGAALEGGYGEGRARPADEADAELADVVARLAAGAPDDVARDLARLGVGAVLVPPVDDGAAGAAGARTGLVGRLDSTLALERMTETPSGVIWRVAAGEVGTTAAWARLRESDAGVPGELVAPLPAEDGTVDTRVPAGSGERVVVLAERADDGWFATLDGAPLRSVQVGWRQAFELGVDGGRLVVQHDAPERTPWLWLQAAVGLATVLLALPVRRRRTR